MPYLVIDDRFGTPIHVFLEDDPRGAAGYPGLAVREVRLEWMAPGLGPYGWAVGQDPREPAVFREFGSDGAVAAARYVLIEPRYVGPTWASYLVSFRPEGTAPRPRSRGVSHRGPGRPMR